MPDQPGAQQPDQRRSSTDWFGAIIGLALIGFGSYLIAMSVKSGGFNQFGLFIALVGVAFLPWKYVSIAGGIALLGWAAWWTFFKATFPMDYLYSVIAAVVGLGAIMERVRTKARRDDS